MPKMTFQIIDDTRFPHWQSVDAGAQAVREAMKSFPGCSFTISKPYTVDFTNTTEGNTQRRIVVSIDYPRGKKQAICAAVNAVIRPPVYKFTKG